MYQVFSKMRRLDAADVEKLVDEHAPVYIPVQSDYLEQARKLTSTPVGGVILENIIKSTDSSGVVTCCGNVASPKLDLSVFPFILRGVTLIGIDSQNYPMIYRTKVWKMLSDKWKPKLLEDTCCEIRLEEIQHKIELIVS